MERVVTINLNGNPYQLEEPAYDALRAYIERAQAALTANPDKAEIIRDLEQAIADKCSGYLSPSKSVVSASEMTRVLEEMGPVEGASEEAPQASAEGVSDGPRPQRRLYRIYDRNAWTGVSAGMAAYAGIGADWMRVLWVLSVLFTGGFTALIYLVMIFVVPVATTSEELAAAHGAPFNAQEVVDRAKREYARFTDENAPRWRANFREQKREWRARTRHWRTYGWDPASSAPPPAPAGYATRMFAGLFAFVFSIVTAALLIGFVVALIALLGSGSILGWAPPASVPIWLAVIVLCIVYAAVSAPFRALRRASFATVSGRHYSAWSRGGDGIGTIIIVLFAAWLFWTQVPDAELMLQQAYLGLHDMIRQLN